MVGHMHDSTGAADVAVKVNGRARRSVLAQVSLVVAAAALLTGALSLGYSWDGWALAIPPIALIVIMVPLLLAGTEWTVDGRELRRRRWYSLPGREPGVVMVLGPRFELVHETRYRWRIQPGGPPLYLRPGQVRALASAMGRAGVRVNDWRGEWAGRNRRLDLAGRLIQFAAAAGMFVAIALGGPMRPAGFIMFWGSMAAMFAGLAIDYLPWSRRGEPKSPPYWPGRLM